MNCDRNDLRMKAVLLFSSEWSSGDGDGHCRKRKRV